MPDKRAQIVQPRCRIDHVVIVCLALAHLKRQGVEARLVPELVYGSGLKGDQLV